MIVGTAGHIDHGKTSLIRRLTGVDTDRLKEEKARGISIDLGFAYWERPSGAIIGFVDVPGHEALVHNMLAGATGIDFVILVVAADDGVMPQTREHLAIMDLLGLTRGVVALSKCDLASPARRRAAEAEVAALLAGTGLAGAPIIPVSAVTGEGLDALAAHIDAASAALSARSSEGRFRLAIDRSFTLQGLGTTVTGTVMSGRVRVGDEVLVSPPGLAARVRSIHAQNRPVGEGRAGERCALVLAGAGIGKETVARGFWIIEPDLHAPAPRIDARLRVLGSEKKPIGQWFPVQLHHGAAQVPARIVLLGGPIAPGAHGLVQLVLERPIQAAAGDKFVVRDTSSSRTVGGGVFVDLRAPERKRRAPERLARLAALEEPDPAVALAKALEGEANWIDLGAFLRDRALPVDLAGPLAERARLALFAPPGTFAAIAQDNWRALAEKIGATLDRFHAEKPDAPGIGHEQLRRIVCERLPHALFAAVIKKLTESGTVAIDRVWVRRPGHEVKLSTGEERQLAAILARIEAQPYRPPRVRDIAKAMVIEEEAVRRLLRLAARCGKVEEIAHDHFFTAASVEAMANVAMALAQRAEDGRFSAAAFRDELDNGRKVAIQILEFFDRHGFTIRRGDLRRINAARADMFVAKAEGPAGADQFQEELRPRWGGRTSNPDGAAARP